MTSERIANRYDLVREIGRGGYGSVWLARDREMERDVAVKRFDVLYRAGDSDEMRQRIELEATATARIDHPNVVGIHDVVRAPDGSEISLVMEYLAGVTLEQILEDGPLEETRARRLLAQALRGLHAAHEVGVVHKDVKPSNLFVTTQASGSETLKIIDFGIARLDSLPSLTATGRVMGSARYLAPEYITGDDVTARVDVYQIGLILAEAVTGTAAIAHVAFAEACRRHVKGELEFDDSLKKTTLWPIVRKATAPNPADRYASAAEFADALQSLDEVTAIDGAQRAVAATRVRGRHEGEVEGPRLAFEAVAEESAAARSAFGSIALAAAVAVAVAVGVGAALLVFDATSSPEVPVTQTELAPSGSAFTPPSAEQLVDVAAYDVSTALLAADLEARIAARKLLKKERGEDPIPLEQEMMNAIPMSQEHWSDLRNVMKSNGKTGVTDSMRDPHNVPVPMHLPSQFTVPPDAQKHIERAMRNPGTPSSPTRTIRTSPTQP